MKTKFIDGEKMSRKYPRPFEIPSAKEKAGIKKMDFVKVATGGERFWVIVQKVDGDKVTGVIDNALVCSDEHGLKYGDAISFSKKNVLSTMPSLKEQMQEEEK